MKDRPQRPDFMTSARSLLSEHAALMVALVASTIVVLRLVTISNLDPITALAILQNLGIANVLVGTLVGVLPVLLVFAFMFVAAYASRRGSKLAGWSAYGLLLIVLVVADWRLVSVATGAVAVSEAAAFVRRRGLRMSRVSPATLRRGRRLASFIAAVANWFAVTYAVLSVFALQPWLAPENVETADGEEFMAYVLREDADGAALLRGDDRHVVYLSDPLESRTVCQGLVSIFTGTSFFQLLIGPDPYEECQSD